MMCLEGDIRKLEIGIPPADQARSRMMQNERRLIRNITFSPQGEKNDLDLSEYISRKKEE